MGNVAIFSIYLLTRLVCFPVDLPIDDERLSVAGDSGASRSRDHRGLLPLRFLLLDRVDCDIGHRFG